VIDWKPYLQSVCQKYAQWWDSYTITNVVGKNPGKQMAKSLLFDLQAPTVKPETIKAEREILNVMEGL
jgi:hypothetical protein